MQKSGSWPCAPCKPPSGKLPKYLPIYTSVSETIQEPPLVKAQTAFKTKTKKIWRITIFNMADRIITPCNVARSRHWFRNVACGSGMTCHGIRPNVRHIGILHLVSILTISPQSTCHSAPVCEISSKSDHRQQKKMTLRWRISAILNYRGPIMGSLKSPCTTSYRSLIETIVLNCDFYRA